MVVDPSMEAVRDSPFLLDHNTGLLTLNMQPHTGMDGMIEFDVLATDPGECCTKFLVGKVTYIFRKLKLNLTWKIIMYLLIFLLFITLFTVRQWT